jgi:hypothetical protein
MSYLAVKSCRMEEDFLFDGKNNRMLVSGNRACLKFSERKMRTMRACKREMWLSNAPSVFSIGER